MEISAEASEGLVIEVGQVRVRAPPGLADQILHPGEGLVIGQAVEKDEAEGEELVGVIQPAKPLENGGLISGELVELGEKVP